MTKKLLRAPPAYQEYASDLLASANFRRMTLAERGLFLTLKLECWFNETVPENATELSSLIGLPEDEIRKNFSVLVKRDFEIINGTILCPELERQRSNLIAKREAQTHGGRKGGQATQDRHRTNQAKLKVVNKEELSRNDLSREELIKDTALSDHKEWIQGFDGKKSHRW
jgi:hypothetical protein